MSSIKLKHSGGNGVIIAAPSSNPASDRTLTVPSNADGTILTTTNPKAGNIIQVLQTVKKDTFSMSGSSFVEVTGLTQAITMTSSSNKVLVTVNVFIASATVGADVGIKLRRTTSGSANDDIFIGDASGNRKRVTLGGYAGTTTWVQEQQTISFLEAPGAGTHTYSIVVNNSGSYTIVVNRNGRDDDQVWEPRAVSAITLMEVAA